MKINLDQATKRYVAKFSSYYETWLFDQPIVTDKNRNDDLIKAGLVLNKLIHHAGSNFLEFEGYAKMPISEKAKDILRVFNKRPNYDVGTYRTDFVFTQGALPKFIEITCQFSLNGFFQSAVYDHYSKRYSEEKGLRASRISDYDAFIPFLKKKIGAAQSICIIKGRDTIQSSRFFGPIFRDAGYEVKEIYFTEIWANRRFIEKSFVVSEIMIDEIESLSMDEICLLSESNLVNDYRTIFIAHDKRFFTLIGDHELQKQVLNPEEIMMLNKYLIETQSMDRPGFDLQPAMENKNDWVLKHINLGRSREVYSGLEFDQKGWEELLKSIDQTQFIMQEWVAQSRFSGTVKGEEHNDYLTGTLLYFDKQYFGLGLFRTSSHIIANKVDNRNIFPLVLETSEQARQVDAVLHF